MSRCARGRGYCNHVSAVWVPAGPPRSPDGSGADERETLQPRLRHPVAFLRAHDPGLATVKRSVCAAVVVPAIFAISRAITSDGQVALFASFGSFALMLFVSIPGTRSDKLRHYLALVAV